MATGSLSCSMRTLSCSMWGIQFLDQGWNPVPLRWEQEVSHWTTKEVPAHIFVVKVQDFSVCIERWTYVRYIFVETGHSRSHNQNIIKKNFFKKINYCKKKIHSFIVKARTIKQIREKEHNCYDNTAAAAAAAKSLQSWLCATPAAHQAPSSLGFSRKEHWSGLPFPSPMHEREKWKWSRSVMSDS